MQLTKPPIFSLIMTIRAANDGIVTTGLATNRNDERWLNHDGRSGERRNHNEWFNDPRNTTTGSAIGGAMTTEAANVVDDRLFSQIVDDDESR